MEQNLKYLSGILENVAGISSNELLNGLKGHLSDIKGAMAFIEQGKFSWEKVRHDIIKPFTTKGAYKWYETHYYPNYQREDDSLNINYCITIECFNDRRKKPFKISVFLPDARYHKKTYSYEMEESVRKSLSRLMELVEKEYPDYIIELKKKMDDTKRDIDELSE